MAKVRRIQIDKRLRVGGSTSGPAWLRVLTGRATRLGIVLALGACGVSLYGPEPLPYRLGQRIQSPVLARVDFDVPDPTTTEFERRKAREGAPSHYAFDPAAGHRVVASLRALMQGAAEQVSLDALHAADGALKVVDGAAYERVKAFTSGQTPEVIQAELDALSAALLTAYTARDVAREPRDPRSTADWIIVHGGSTEAQESRVVPLDKVAALEEPEKVRKLSESAAACLSEALRPAATALIQERLTSAPTLRYEADRTLREMGLAVDRIPEARFACKRGEAFVVPAAGVRSSVLTTREKELLEAHREAWAGYLRSEAPGAAAERNEARLQTAGRLTLVALVAIGLVVYLAQHHPRMLESRTKCWAFSLLVLCTLISARLLSVQWPDYRELTLAPALVCASAFAIFFPSRLAIGAMSILCVIVVLVSRESLTLLLTMATASSVMAFQLSAIRARTRILTAGLVTAVAAPLAGISGDLVGGESLAFALQSAGWGAACSLGAAFFVSGVLPFAEGFFRLATPLMLMQWRDSRQPLLQLLAREAPGTYQHSLTVSKLAEEACQAIGADDLLASVGALYHDVGKILKPEYFTENQTAQINLHSTLAPKMSLLIILAHVKDGVELAREYRLPPALIPFIREHHGTTLVRYFHNVAAERQPSIATGRHDRGVPEAEFRYPGPKPRTRETAVLMLCDGVEGAVRSLRDPAPGRIENVVHSILMDRLNDGQFDACEITLADLHKVEQALVKALCSLYHGRVAYPKAGEGGGRREAPPQPKPAAV
ncbi:MAG: HDIG domain-containing protein [Phycisphaerae bacterium]|nr:MAG: HDIG domain-containing protein [Planctomycetota bacterium]MBE7455258.1 HDIG domain-containing protein [Planctomycetia bacterium]MCK6464071.1 HDIG domain-containing protein [Phycisphaerae bacterium]MCL4717756.1 HDIG domain-containing protein [Phycisphaerae bacterium]MCQ3919803.1 hypothetical protein [Planctomycetota bacterium]